MHISLSADDDEPFVINVYVSIPERNISTVWPSTQILYGQGRVALNNGEKGTVHTIGTSTYDGRRVYVCGLLNSQFGAISVRRGKKKVLSVRLRDAVKVCSQMR